MLAEFSALLTEVCNLHRIVSILEKLSRRQQLPPRHLTTANSSRFDPAARAARTNSVPGIARHGEEITPLLVVSAMYEEKNLLCRFEKTTTVGGPTPYAEF